jgi:hypothetical protein
MSVVRPLFVTAVFGKIAYKKITEVSVKCYFKATGFTRQTHMVWKNLGVSKFLKSLLSTGTLLTLYPIMGDL